MGSTIFSAGGGQAAIANFAANLDAISRQARIIVDSAGEIGRSLNPGGRPSLRQLLDSMGLSALPLPSLQNARTCAVPSCDCPPPDLGELRRLVDRPGPVQIAVRFRNTSKKQRIFDLSAGELVDAGGTVAGKMSLEPAQVTLEPGQTTALHITAELRDMQPGVDYSAAVRITAEHCETMYLGVVIRLQPEIERVPVIDLHCCCDPRLRPLKWYHHYYCDPAPNSPRASAPAPDADPRG